MKRSNIILIAIFIDIVLIMFSVKGISAASTESPPWLNGAPLALYNNPFSGSGSGGTIAGAPIPVPSGFCSEPFTVNVTLASISGIPLTSSDFTNMINYLQTYGANMSDVNSIISACKISPGLYRCDPRFLAAIWGQESSFSTGGGAGESFNCFGGEPNSFSPELQCAINSLLSYVKTFQSEMQTQHVAVDGAGTSAACKTTDLFTYMMEEYTPINGNFGNSANRGTLNQFLTTFLGSSAIVTG